MKLLALVSGLAIVACTCAAQAQDADLCALYPEEPLTQQHCECNGISNDIERLQCFDGLGNIAELFAAVLLQQAREMAETNAGREAMRRALEEYQD